MADSLDYFLPNITTADVRRRLKAYEELVEYLKTEHSSLRCQEMDHMVDGLCSWISSSNFKVCLSLYVCMHI